MIKKYNKLIRDLIPEIIKRAGEKSHIRILDRREYFTEIKNKILEEAKELTRAQGRKKIINEIVDVQELIDALIAEIGITKLELRDLQRRKNKKRGGFKKRLFLIKTETKPRA